MSDTTIGQQLADQITAELADELEPSSGTYHALHDGLTVPGLAARIGTPGRTLLRGDNIVVDENLREAARDRNSFSPFDDLSDEAQIKNWGRVYLAPGSLDENPSLKAQIEGDAAQLVAQLEQERKRQRHQYGRA